MQTVIAKCTCKHEYQDKVYGPGMRVKHVPHKGNRKGEPKCTVCGPPSVKKKHCGYRVGK